MSTTHSASLVSGVDFVTIWTKDFDASAAFYERVLGLRCTQRYDRAPGGEFETGNLTLQVLDAAAIGRPFQVGSPIALHVDDFEGARAELESRGVSFLHAFDSGVCHQAIFTDPDGNVLILHRRYAPRGPAHGADAPAAGQSEA